MNMWEESIFPAVRVMISPSITKSVITHVLFSAQVLLFIIIIFKWLSLTLWKAVSSGCLRGPAKLPFNFLGQIFLLIFCLRGTGFSYNNITQKYVLILWNGGRATCKLYGECTRLGSEWFWFTMICMWWEQNRCMINCTKYVQLIISTVILCGIHFFAHGKNISSEILINEAQCLNRLT